VFHPLILGNVTHVDHGVQLQLRLVEVHRVVPLLLEDVLEHRSQSSLVLFKLVMGVSCVKLAIATRFEKTRVNRVVVLLS
jgi:hypothetical protein